jgi:hypothetical protein
LVNSGVLVEGNRIDINTPQGVFVNGNQVATVGGIPVESEITTEETKEGNAVNSKAVRNALTPYSTTQDTMDYLDENYAKNSEIPAPTVIPEKLLTLEEHLDYDDGKGGSIFGISSGEMDMEITAHPNNKSTLSSYSTNLKISAGGVYYDGSEVATKSDIPEPTVIPSDLSNLNDILTCTKEDKPITLAKMEIAQKGNMKLATTGITNSITLDASGVTLQITPDGVYVSGTKLNPVIDINVPIYENNQQTGYYTKNAVSGEAVQAHVENEIWNMTKNVDILDSLCENLPVPIVGQVDDAITFESGWNGVSFAHVFGGVVVMEILINNTEDKPLTNTTLFWNSHRRYALSYRFPCWCISS